MKLYRTTLIFNDSFHNALLIEKKWFTDRSKAILAITKAKKAKIHDTGPPFIKGYYKELDIKLTKTAVLNLLNTAT